MSKATHSKGFTLIELIIVIVVLGIIAVVALPRFIDLQGDARAAAINSLAAQVETAAELVQNKARVQGLRPTSTNPGGLMQTEFLVDFGFASAEVNFNSLCPESIAESGDALNMFDFIASDIRSDMQTRIDNQFTLIGFTLPVTGVPTNEGCYLFYDSFAALDCTVIPVTVDC